MITIKEYKEKHGFTVKALADHLDISLSSAHRWLGGFPGNGESVEKMRNFGIDLPLRPFEATGIRNKPKKVEALDDPGDNFITDIQIAIVKKFGNTIISKKYKPDDIIKGFAKHGLDIVIRNFECTAYPGYETHYVVETLDRLKDRVKKQKNKRFM